MKNKVKMLENIETLTLQQTSKNDKKLALKPNFHTVKCFCKTFLKITMIFDNQFLILARR